MIESPCKIEFIPAGGEAVVLVDVGDWLTQLPRFDASQGLFELDGIDAGESFFRPLGGAAVTISFASEADMEIEDARDTWLTPELVDAVDLLLVTGALVITGETSVATYEPAVITSIRPTLPTPLASVGRAFEVRAALPEIESLLS